MPPRLLGLLSGVLLGTLNESSLTPVLPLLAQALGVGPGEAQGVVSLGLLGSALAYLPVGYWAPRWGPARAFRSGVFLHALLALALYLAAREGWGGVYGLYALRFLQGLATALVVGLVPALAAAALPENRGYALGLVAGTVALGTLLGPALGGLVAGGLGPEAVFLLPLPLSPLALLLSGGLPGLSPSQGRPQDLLRAPGLLRALLATSLYFAHTPIGPRHAGAVNRLLSLFMPLQTRGLVLISVQNPLRLGGFGEPRPDLVLLRPREDFYASSHPTSEDALLVVEVAEVSLEYDRQVKLPLYARWGVQEAWLLDLLGDRLEVHRDPSPEGYRQTQVLSRGDRVAPLAFPGFALGVADLLG